MTNSITNRQMFFILFFGLTTYTVISIAKAMVECAGTGGWIPILVMALIFAVAVTTIVRLNNMFQGKVLFDYSREIVGKFTAYVIGIYYILYFLLIGIYLNVEVANMIRAEFYPETPQWATLLLGISVFGFIAYKGVTNVARLFEIYGIVSIITAVAVFIIMFTQGMSYNIFPLFNKADTGKYIAALKDAVFPFLGIEILTIIPFTQKNGKKATKTAFFTLIAIGLYYVLVVESTVQITGFHNITSYQYPLIEAVRLVETPLFERADILYLTVGFMGLIAGLSIVYLAVVEYACRVFAMAKRGVVVIITGAVLVVACILALGIKEPDMFLELFTFMGLVAGIVIPTVLFVIARIKKRAG